MLLAMHLKMSIFFMILNDIERSFFNNNVIEKNLLAYLSTLRQNTTSMRYQW